MAEAHDEELRILRSRAYGPSADIQSDPQAMERLRSLEAQRRDPGSGIENSEPQLAFEPPAAEPAAELEDEVERPYLLSAGIAIGARTVRRVLAYLASLRRSTWMIVVGLAVIASILITALVLVQRVQTDPLQVGATQVARLSLDTGYDVPAALFGTAAEGKPVQGFQEFHGLRAVLSSNGLFYGTSPDGCITVYAPTEVTFSGGGFSGRFFSGCAAGGFPAMTQFRSDVDGVPNTLVEVFPDSTALQFVYDRDNNEVVVFALGSVD